MKNTKSTTIILVVICAFFIYFFLTNSLNRITEEYIRNKIVAFNNEPDRDAATILTDAALLVKLSVGEDEDIFGPFFYFAGITDVYKYIGNKDRYDWVKNMAAHIKAEGSPFQSLPPDTSYVLPEHISKWNQLWYKLFNEKSISIGEAVTDNVSNPYILARLGHMYISKQYTIKEREEDKKKAENLLNLALEEIISRGLENLQLFPEMTDAFNDVIHGFVKTRNVFKLANLYESYHDYMTTNHKRQIYGILTYDNYRDDIAINILEELSFKHIDITNELLLKARQIQRNGISMLNHQWRALVKRIITRYSDGLNDLKLCGVLGKKKFKEVGALGEIENIQKNRFRNNPQKLKEFKDSGNKLLMETIQKHE